MQVESDAAAFDPDVDAQEQQVRCRFMVAHGDNAYTVVCIGIDILSCGGARKAARGTTACNDILEHTTIMQ